jgi:hypothetical protein
VEQQLGEESKTLFQQSENLSHLSPDAAMYSLGRKLDAMSKMLGLNPYNKHGHFEGKLHPITPIQPVYLICPETTECSRSKCSSRSLLQGGQDHDIPHVTFIKGCQMHDDAYVRSG